MVSHRSFVGSTTELTLIAASYPAVLLRASSVSISGRHVGGTETAMNPAPSRLTHPYSDARTSAISGSLLNDINVSSAADDPAARCLVLSRLPAYSSRDP